MTRANMFLDDGQKMEISISADGDFGDTKKTEMAPLQKMESWQICIWPTQVLSTLDKLVT